MIMFYKAYCLIPILHHRHNFLALLFQDVLQDTLVQLRVVGSREVWHYRKEKGLSKFLALEFVNVGTTHHFEHKSWHWAIRYILGIFINLGTILQSFVY